MPATTTRGFPYPVGTDRVMDGDDAIRSLAEFTDTRVGLTQKGQVSIPVTAANTTASIAVTFPVAFPAGVTPVVTASIGATSHGPGSISTWISAGTSNTGFTLNGQRTAATAIPMNWQAIG